MNEPKPPMPAPGNPLQRSWAMNAGGVLQAVPLSTMVAQAEEAARERAELANDEPLVQNLAAHVRRCWSAARDARAEVTRDMLEAAYARDGRYTPEMEAQLREQDSSLIYMMLFATKARQAKALVGDVLLGSGVDKPWTVSPTPLPDLPEDVVAGVLQATVQQVAEAEMSGVPMTQDEVAQMLRDARDRVTHSINEEASWRARRLEKRMEDMLLEGGFYQALDEFLDNLMTYRTAFIKGPVIRRKATLAWATGPDGTAQPEVSEELLPTWYAPDPMKIYPSKGAATVQDGYLIELHDLSADALQELIGVEGYSEDAIRQVLTEMGTSERLRTWTDNPMDRPDVDRPLVDNPVDTVEAVQFWGRVPGSLLIEWGLSEDEVPDTARHYEVEVWLVDRWAIKCVLSADPLARRPYVSASFSSIPGRVWGGSLYDTMRDCEAMCNSAARALDVNMGISSGPQVGVDVSRLPDGEDLTSMYPWKTWQFTRDPMGNSGVPLSFFQPSSNATELMGVYDRFSTLADEYTGIPRYMTGLAGGDGGAGRTASGMSMMIGNASKTIKSVVASLDTRIFTPLLEMLHTFIMQYVDDPDAKGDLKIVARGALSMTTKEAAQVRRNEFLQATANPTDMQIVGLEGRAALLREMVKGLDINPDLVVPPLSTLRMRQKLQAQQAEAQQKALMQAQAQAQAQQGQQPGKPDQTQLANGAPVTQHFDQAAQG